MMTNQYAFKMATSGKGRPVPGPATRSTSGAPDVAVMRAGRRTEKNGKDREVPVPPFLGEAIREYCAGRASTDWLFVGESGKPLSDRNLIQRHVYPVAGKLEIPHFSWHSLRHTFSSLGGNEGSIPTRVMKQLLGHSRLSTTDRYMHELAGPEREAVQEDREPDSLPAKESERRMKFLIQMWPTAR